METRTPIFARRWILFAMVLVLAGVGFAIGYQKHVLWVAIVLAALGAALGWLLWVMIRVAIMTFLGALLGGVILGLVRGNLWFVGAFVGACAGFYAGWHLHKRMLWKKQPSPAPVQTNNPS
jgi:hypothetical protein